MKRLLTVAALFAAGGLIAAQSAAAGDAETIKSAEAAAPAAVSSGATIYAWGEGGAMKTLREGTNGYWCMPDDPNKPGDGSMCGDANAMEWLMAIVEKKDPPKGKIGLVYMLAGIDYARKQPRCLFGDAPRRQRLREDGPAHHDRQRDGPVAGLFGECQP